MRPVNLIPPEQRRGDRAPLRAGSLSYAIVGALAAILIGVYALVSTGNTITDREAEVATLEDRQAEVSAQAEALSPYVELATLQEQRQSTVSSLASSRFDWERVLRELSLVVPSNVWLTSLNATVSPTSAIGSAANELRASVEGPALSMVGCGESHEAVADFAAALEDIDGVTRVGVSRSAKAADSEGGGGDGGECDAKSFVASFDLVVAFDEVVAPAVAATEPGAVPAATDPSVAGAQEQEQTVRDSTTKQAKKAKNATNLVPGVAR